MLPRHHRRRVSLINEPERRKPKRIVRLAAVAIVLFITWYVASRILTYFDGSIGRKTATLLTVRSGQTVQVSLQGGDWQRGESNLKLYAGDSVAVRGDSDAILTFFDGSRMRLEKGSEVTITESNKLESSASSIAVDLKTGRLWTSTASQDSFTGSIVREVKTTHFIASIPGESEVLISSSLVNVVRASNLGVRMSFILPKTKISEIYIGEGQYFNFSEEAKRALENNRDPYIFRDPVTQQLLKDEFLISSYAYFTSNSGNEVANRAASGSTSSVDSLSEDLVIVSPTKNAKFATTTVKVSGTVSERVTTLRVNGQNITVSPNRSFSVDVSLSKDKTTTIKVEAEDKQGIGIAAEERTVENAFDVKVEPVRIKSPVGSGETLKTGVQEIEITGEAPIGTASVVVNDYALQLFKPGSKTWSYLASTKLGNIVVGKNVFTVYAVDADKNRSPARSITIEYSEGGGTVAGSTSSSAESTSSLPPLKQNPPIAPGSLTVTGPVQGSTAEISEKEIVLEGTTASETNSISINGYTLSLYKAGKTTWNYIASTDLGTMKRGKNVYRIVSRNDKGEILDVLEYSITYNP